MAAHEWWGRMKGEVRREIDSSLPPAVLPPAVLPPAVLPTQVPAPTRSSLALDSTAALVIAPTTTSTATTATTTSSTIPTPVSTQAPATNVSAETATAKASTGDGSGDMSVAAKAGIVIGVLAGVLAVFVLVYMVFSMRRRQLDRRRQQIEDDEKINGPFADSAAIRPPTTAPRLSLRPVTQFLPIFNNNNNNNSERRTSRGIPLTLNPVSAPSTTSLAPLNRPAAGGRTWERPALRSTANRPGPHKHRRDSSNPFNDTQRIPDEPGSPVSSPSSLDHRVGIATTTDSIPEPVSPIGGDEYDETGAAAFAREGEGAAGASTSKLTRKTSMRKYLPKPLDLTKPPSPLYSVPPSPAGTEYSMHSISPGQSRSPSSSAAANAAAGGPAQSTVHRVQLDFKPTLNDELELRTGQLVRLLHEYDDGWALCIRLDRSQKGVAPRTCLSTRPVKPRPPQGAASSRSSSSRISSSRISSSRSSSSRSSSSSNLRSGPPINPYFTHHHNRHQSSGSGSGRYGYGGNNSNDNNSRPVAGPVGRAGGGRSPSPSPMGRGYGYGNGNGFGSGHGYGEMARGGSAEDAAPGAAAPPPGQAY